jgi:hypothetical protein
MSLLDRALPGVAAEARVTFTERPIAVDGTDRLSYRLSLLVLALAACKSSSSSYARLALINFAARSSRLRSQLLRIARNISVPSDSGIRFDPLFPRIISLACALGLTESVQERSAFILTEQGSALAALLEEHRLLALEADFVKRAVELLPETAIDRLLRGA